jgi:periplasmic protein TonB
MQSALAIALLVAGHPCPATDLGRPTSPPTPPRLRSGTISNDDYPAAAIAALAEGTTRASLEIDANGRVTGCSVTDSSGNAALDSTTCSLTQRRYRFAPATRGGQPVPTTYSVSVRWMLPPPPPPIPEGPTATDDQPGKPEIQGR